MFKEIDKWRCGFLWAGKERASGDQCMVAWGTACLPQRFGGLGIPDLRITSNALRLRWLWLKRTDAARPWRTLELDFGSDRAVQDMFQASIDVLLGDGCLALLWADRWCSSSSPCILAPDLCALMRPRERNRRTVVQATHDKLWIMDITRQLTIPTLRQYLALWRVVEAQGVQLRAGTEDTVSWHSSPSHQ